MVEYFGKIAFVRYYNESNHFIVCSLDVDEESSYISATGYMPMMNTHERYHFKGQYVMHPKYGQQFQIDSYEVVLPDERQEVIRYLSSSLFKGIGEKQATAIVDCLGDNALSCIKENPNVLDQVRGMNLKKKQTILDVLMTEDYDAEVLSFFMGHGISTRYLAMIQAVYEEHTLEVLQDNPYRMIDDIDGIGFQIADELALKIGFDPRHEERIQACIYYSLKEICFKDGSTYHSLMSIYRRFHQYIPFINEDEFYEHLNMVIDEHKIIVDYDRYYPCELYESEINSVAYLQKWLNMPDYVYEDNELQLLISTLQQQLSITYDESQLRAISSILCNPITILTGGPGTGKTTLVQAVIKLYHQLNPDCEIALVAPTGRAAKRLGEVTGLDACTIHRLLKWDLHTNTFNVDHSHPLHIDLLVVDEFSMVDSILLERLLDASLYVSQIVFIGDDQQLPSVAPGMVLKDLIDSCKIPMIRLQHIYRQNHQSGIIELAHTILNQQYQPSLFDEYEDIHFQPCLSFEVLHYVKLTIKELLNLGYDLYDIQVLAPMYNGVAGIDALNICLQDLFNPLSYQKEYRVGKKIFREGDKVLQLKNRVDDNVFNGDIGILEEIILKDHIEYLNDTFIVDFDGQKVCYSGEELSTLTLAYCMSIHKSQGNEFKAVIMPLVREYRIMLQKNLIYTGLTRAKQRLYIIGEHDAFVYGINKSENLRRQTSLKERLSNYKGITLEDFDK